MAVDTWSDQQDSVSDRANAAVRFVLVAFTWMALVAGPPIVGGVLGWMATRDMSRSGPVSGLLVQLPTEDVPALVTREEVEAVGLEPRDVQAILTR